MGKRTWIDSDIWADTDDLNLTEKVFYLYLLTNSQRNIAGYYRFNIRYAVLDLGMADDHIEALLERKQKYWVYDRATGQVLIPKFTKYNIVKSKQQYAKLNAELNDLKPSPLHQLFIRSWEEVNGIGSVEMLDEKFKSKAY